MIDVPLDAKVECTDGPVGRSTHVIIDPIKRIVTHFVVTDEEPLVSHEWLVPLDKVAKTDRKTIHLNCTVEEVRQLESFVDLQYIPSDRSEQSYPADAVYLAPYASPMRTDIVSIEVERVPPNEIAFRRGARVEATDGDVGTLGEFIVEPESGAITHFILQEGHFWGKKEVTLPLSAVDRAIEDTVYLKLDKKAVSQLPAIPVQRDRGEKHARDKVELIARIYDQPAKAEEALEFVKKLGYVKLKNAALLIKDEEGNTRIKETQDVDTKRGRLVGAITGGVVGLVGGPVGAVIGALAGAGTGAFAAKHIDMGFSNEFLDKFQEQLKPGGAALIVLVEHEYLRPLSESMEDLGGVLLQYELTDQIIEQFAGAGQEEAGGEEADEDGG